MTAEKMLALYEEEAGRAVNLWEMALPIFLYRTRAAAGGGMAGAAGTVWESGAVREMKPVPAAAAEEAFGFSLWTGVLPEENFTGPAGIFLPETGVFPIGKAEFPFMTETENRESTGRKLRESVLAAERISLGVRENAQKGDAGFRAVYAELERRLAIELGAG